MNTLWSLVLSLCVLTVLVGCSTTQVHESLRIEEVKPGKGETVVREQVYVLADVSGTMNYGAKYSELRSLVTGFVDGMPSGSYDAGLGSFGGKEKADWLRHSMGYFNRGELAASASQIEYLGGLTPLATAVDGLRTEFGPSDARAALIVFSDGGARRGSVIDACERLLDVHAGELCIYTVAVGSDAKGASLLREMAELSGCGKSMAASDVSTAAGMEDLIGDVFFDVEPDSDGDGVIDRLDHCPGTPSGVEVDEVGCPLDTDGDGVLDHEDACPGTPKGAKVDSSGCWVLKGLNFDTNKHDIKPEFDGLINEVANVLSQNPGIRIRVDGHTDTRGSAEYNLTLSKNRAKAVKDALVKKGIAANRLKSKGFGESKPAMPEDSEENLYLNRRVELTVLP